MYRIWVMLIAVNLMLNVIDAHAKEKVKHEQSLKPFMLLSPSFENDAEIPQVYTCQGSDVSPALEIYYPPAKTKSLAITMIDIDAPEGEWTHWGIYNIKPDQLSLAQHQSPGPQVLNDFGNYQYAGPCPSNDREHRYVFTVYALNKEIPENESWTVNDLRKNIKSYLLASATLTGKYKRKSNQ